jgi:hypothetical protein
VWERIAQTSAGFPWLAVAGKALAGWLVIDMDATLITAYSNKEGAAPMSRLSRIRAPWRVLRHRGRRVSGCGVPPGTVEPKRPRAGLVTSDHHQVPERP